MTGDSFVRTQAEAAPLSRDAGAETGRSSVRAGGERKPSRRLPAWVPRAVAVAAALGIWWWGSLVAPGGSVPSPWETVTALVRIVGTSEFWLALADTVGTFAVAIAVCLVVGIPVGLAVGASRFATASTRLVFDFLRTIPPIAILPLVLLLFGATNVMVLVMAIAGGLWPILIQSVYAAGQTEPQLNDMARAFRIRGVWRGTRIFAPSVLPFVMTGARIATTICLLLTIGGELLGSAPGIGNQIQLAMNRIDNPGVYAYVLVSALLGVAVNAGFWQVQKRLLHWHPSFRAEVHA